MNLIERYTLQRGIKTSRIALASKNSFIDNYILSRLELNKQFQEYQEQQEQKKKEKEFEEAIEKAVEKVIDNIFKE